MSIDNFVLFLRTSIRAGIDVQAALQMIPEEHRESVWSEFLEQSLPVEKPGVLESLVEDLHWSSSASTAQGFHWNRLRNQLLESGLRTDSEIDSLDQITDNILFKLHNPKFEDSSHSDKGLVVGYVQSGKTANYTALIAKGLDSGFRIVIVLAGIHNSLRRQTQLRLNRELGVGDKTIAPDKQIVSMTRDDLKNGDFQDGTLSSDLLLGSSNFLFVTKKNAHVLKRLNSWLGERKIHTPVLIIDDEADQASINTGGNRSDLEHQEILESMSDSVDQSRKDDLDPSVINSQIRKLLSKFTRTSYVAYTATPYANVFIQHDGFDRIVGADLFPRNFIVSLPKPKSYMGPEEFFGEFVTGSSTDTSHTMQLVFDSEVLELEDLVSSSINPHFNSVSELVPDGLKRAVFDFVIGTSLSRIDSGQKGPSSCLIHASHLAAKQNSLGEILKKFLAELRVQWRYDSETAMPEWQERYAIFCQEAQIDSNQFPFARVCEEINLLFTRGQGIPVLVLNTTSQDELDYEIEPNLVAIVVGGNKLSRGLTLEGLITSYFVRTVREVKADTLTQMGRFFGYRRSVLPFTRLYTTEKLRCDFRDISLVEDHLRKEIFHLQRLGKTPIEFAIRVMALGHMHPTAKNKMKTARKIGDSYSGDLLQITTFPSANELIEVNQEKISPLSWNIDITKSLLKDISQAGHVYREKGAVRGWLDVPGALVLDFMRNFVSDSQATRFKCTSISNYIDSLQRAGELTNWAIGVVSRGLDPRLGFEDFGGSYRFGRVERALENGSRNSIRTLINPVSKSSGSGDELFDLDDTSVLRAQENVQNNDGDLRFSESLRSLRDPKSALLLIYPISPSSVGRSRAGNSKRIDLSLGDALFDDSPQHTIVGLSIVFPYSKAELENLEFWVGSLRSS
jgi:hypothetical protein